MKNIILLVFLFCSITAAQSKVNWNKIEKDVNETIEKVFNNPQHQSSEFSKIERKTKRYVLRMKAMMSALKTDELINKQNRQCQMTTKDMLYIWNRINPVFADIELDGLQETKAEFLRRLRIIINDRIKENGKSYNDKRHN